MWAENTSSSTAVAMAWCAPTDLVEEELRLAHGVEVGPDGVVNLLGARAPASVTLYSRVTSNPNASQPSRDPSTGWRSRRRCHSAGGATQYSSFC